MTDIPEHLLRRSRERRKALGLPAEGEEGEESAETPAAEGEAPAPTPSEPAPPAAAGPSDEGGEKAKKAGIPAHLLERSRQRKAALKGKEPAPAAEKAAPAGAPTKTKAPAAPAATGPAGHTQRLLTVVKSGSIQQTRAKPVDKVHTWPHLLAMEFTALLLLTALVTIFSAVVRAPLLGLADPNQTPNPSKAPWYFLGLQELLTMFQPMVAGVTIPGIGILGLMAAPYLDNNPSQKPADRKFAISLFTLFLLFWAVLVIIGSFFRGTGFNFLFPWDNPIFFEL